MAMQYRPSDPQIYNRIRGFAAASMPQPAAPAMRSGPSNVMPFGGPRLPEVNQGAPMQGNPMLGSFPVEPSRYGNSMGQGVMRGEPMPGSPVPPPAPQGPRMPGTPRPTHPPQSKYAPTGPQRSGPEMRAPQPFQQPPPAAEHSQRFMQMLQNTARMNDVERANYINSQRDALMERLARYDFAKTRGLQLDESAQADYDNIAKMIQEINRYNKKIADMQRAIDTGKWRQRPPWSGTIRGLPIMQDGSYMPNDQDWLQEAIEALDKWNSPREVEKRLRLQQEELQRMLDELAQYRTGGYGL